MPACKSKGYLISTKDIHPIPFAQTGDVYILAGDELQNYCTPPMASGIFYETELLKK